MRARRSRGLLYRRRRIIARMETVAMAGEAALPLNSLLQMGMGLWQSRALWLAARFRIADAIGNDPESIETIATRSQADPDALERLLMALSAFGVFRMEPDGRVSHSDSSRLLRSDHPLSQRSFVESVFGHEHYEAWGAIEEALRTGCAAFDVRYGAPVFVYFQEHPEAGRLFGEAMTSLTRLVEEAVLAAHDFGPFELGVDVGGSQGTLLRRIMSRTPGARGILFDLPRVVEAAQQAWQGTDEATRLSVAGGDFFEAVPEDGDLYLLKFILHDWDDARSIQILRNVRAAIRPHGRVVIMEMVLPEDNSAHPGWLMDLNMLVMTGGRERRAAQYEALFHAAGLEGERVIATASPISIIIARPV